LELASIARTMNFEAKTMAEEGVIRQGHGARARRRRHSDSGRKNFAGDKFAYTMQGGSANPQPDQADLGPLDILMQPQGLIRAAMAPGANPVLILRYEAGAVGTLAGLRMRKPNRINALSGRWRDEPD
jgi:hypothetical protein